MNKIYLNHRKEVLSLYRTSIQMTTQIGYELGDHRKNTYFQKNYSKLKLEERKKIIFNLKKKDLGAYVAYNIKKVFKDNKKLTDPEKVKQSIDYSYHFIRNMPKYLFPYCKEYLEDLWCYESNK